MAYNTIASKKYAADVSPVAVLLRFTQNCAPASNATIAVIIGTTPNGDDDDITMLFYIVLRKRKCTNPKFVILSHLLYFSKNYILSNEKICMQEEYIVSLFSVVVLAGLVYLNAQFALSAARHEINLSLRDPMMLQSFALAIIGAMLVFQQMMAMFTD